ncbi:MAG: hypothetical protein ACREAM_24290, partial [Blastocatellia bacterium]
LFAARNCLLTRAAAVYCFRQPDNDWMTKGSLMATDNDLDNTQPLDPQIEVLRSMIRLLLEEQLQPIKDQLSRVEMEEEAKARYVDLRSRLAKTQEGLDVLNNKFDALADEVRYLRKSVRLMEDKVDSLTV